MKNIIDLYEGLLKDMEDHLSMTDDDVKDMMTLGSHIKLHVVVGCTEANANLLNAQALKTVTKGLPYIDDRIERGAFDKRNKIKMFANWISNMTTTDLGLDCIDPADNKWRGEFIKSFETKCGANGIFQNPFHTYVASTSTQKTGKKEFEVMVVRSDKCQVAFKLIFDIIK